MKGVETPNSCALQVVKHMMGAFEGRCKQLYGTSAFAKRPPAAQKIQPA
jgi:hypothetical protein